MIYCGPYFVSVDVTSQGRRQEFFQGRTPGKSYSDFPRSRWSLGPHFSMTVYGYDRNIKLFWFCFWLKVWIKLHIHEPNLQHNGGIPEKNHTWKHLDLGGYKREKKNVTWLAKTTTNDVVTIWVHSKKGRPPRRKVTVRAHSCSESWRHRSIDIRLSH